MSAEPRGPSSASMRASSLELALAELLAAALDARPYLLNAADVAATGLDLLEPLVAARRLDALDGAIASAQDLLP